MGIKSNIRQVVNRFRNLWLRVSDPRRITEMAGERVVFHHLQSQGLLDGFENKRILEIGPKHGRDSLLLATMNPGELVLIDLPEKDSKVKEWLPRVPCKTTYIQGNILYLVSKQHRQLGTFDLIWCLGVLYHNVEQLRFLKRLYDLCNDNGKIVIESATTKNKRLGNLNVVEIHWPNTYRDVPTITHLPSRWAIKSWLEMVGFRDVKIWDVYSRTLGWQRAVLTGIKTSDSRPYVSYAESGLNPIYVVGDAE